MCHAERVSVEPTDPRPRDDRTVIAIAWAVAAVVIALAVAFIAWLAMGRDGDGDVGVSPATTSSPTASDEAAVAEESTEAEEPEAEEGAAPDPTARTPSPEVAQMLLDLQRRDPDDPMAVGDVDAPVVMIEYADYRCPYCARFQLETRPELLPLVEDGTLRIEFRDFVIFEETSELAAVAGRAAAEQGRLEEFQEAVFALSTKEHAEFDAADLVAIAEDVGVPDVEKFEADLEDEELLAAVRTDTEEASSLGVSSTPTFFINTQVLQGAYPTDQMISIVEDEAATAQE